MLRLKKNKEDNVEEWGLHGSYPHPASPVNPSILSRVGGERLEGETTLGHLILGSGLGAFLTLISKQYLGIHY